MATIIPKLGLQRIRDNALDEYALDKAKKISDSGNFPGVSPTGTEGELKTNWSRVHHAPC